MTTHSMVAILATLIILLDDEPPAGRLADSQESPKDEKVWGGTGRGEGRGGGAIVPRRPLFSIQQWPSRSPGRSSLVPSHSP
jgi:hypothetical protein